MASTLSKQNFHINSEQGINQQINLKQRGSLNYASISAYFGRDNVALPGLEKFFKKYSEEKTKDAKDLIDYLNKRGGKVIIQRIQEPESDWKSAKNAVEVAIQLEKDVNSELLSLHATADETADPQMTDFLEGQFLAPQVQLINVLAEKITQLSLVGGDGLGLYLWDQELLRSLDN